MDQSQREDIERFVRHTLGCECPEEVFRSVAFETVDKAGDLRFTRLVVGDRLLVYVIEPRSEEPIADRLPELAALGRTERDERHYNRFRLVIAVPQADCLSAMARRSFSAAIGQDARAHLHVIATDALPETMRLRWPR